MHAWPHDERRALVWAGQALGRRGQALGRRGQALAHSPTFEPFRSLRSL